MSYVFNNLFSQFFLQIFLSWSSWKRKQISYWSKVDFFQFAILKRNHNKFSSKIRWFGIWDWWNYLMNQTYEDWRLGSLEIASKIWGRPFHVNCSDFQWDCFHLSQKIKVHEIFLAKDTRETFMCPIAEVTWVSTQR